MEQEEQVVARYANQCAIPPGKHPSRVQVHDMCFNPVILYAGQLSKSEHLLG
jgi:hypothetical protein